MSTPQRKNVFVFREGIAVQPCQRFLLCGYCISVHGFIRSEECLRALCERSCSLLAVALDGTAGTGFKLLTQSSQLYPLLFTVAVVNTGDVHMAVRATKAGACDCVETPSEGEWWLRAIEKALAEWQPERSHSNGTLTEMEKFILNQVVAGRTSRQIADAIGRSPRTIEVHRMHIMRKAGVSSTAELVRQAMKKKQSPEVL